MIRLLGEFELDEYWREVRQTGNDRLKEFGLEEWVVTLRPMTAADSEKAGAHEQQAAVAVGLATAGLLGTPWQSYDRQLIDCVAREHHLSPAVVTSRRHAAGVHDTIRRTCAG